MRLSTLIAGCVQVTHVCTYIRVLMNVINRLSILQFNDDCRMLSEVLRGAARCCVVPCRAVLRCFALFFN